MTQQHKTPRPFASRLFWTCAVGSAAFALYLIMVMGPLAQLEALAGAPVFDMRPTGYGPEVARALIETMGEGGRQIYLTRQLWLDAAYPPLMAGFLSLLFGSLLSGRPALVGQVLAWAACGFDWAENAGIAAMLLTAPDTSDALIRGASAMSMAKAGATTLAVSFVLGAILWRLARWAVGGLRARTA